MIIMLKKREYNVKGGYMLLYGLVVTFRLTHMYRTIAWRRHCRAIVSFPSTEASWHELARGIRHADLVDV
jgi:hypothetical protein